MCVCVLVAQFCPTLCNPTKYTCMCAFMLRGFRLVRLCVTLWTVACQVPLSLGFSRQEYWSGLPCLPPGDLPEPGIKPVASPAFSVLQEDSLPLSHPGSPIYIHTYIHTYIHAAAAKSLQSCPTLCDPRDGSPPGSPVPGILQARTLEWAAISFSTYIHTYIYIYI